MTASHRFCLSLAVLAGCAGIVPVQAGLREEWRRRDDRLISRVEDKAGGAVRDAAGNVIVAGSSGNDAVIVKYASDNGAVLWERRDRGTGFLRDAWAAVAVDAAGNVLAAGYVWNGADCDYLVAKFAAADGSLLWRKQYDGPEQGDDRAGAVAVDAAGDVVVTGESGRDESDGSPFLGDYLTRKYRGTDGALLWERRYEQPENARLRTRAALALDAAGNAVLTGCAVAADGSEQDRLYVAKYAAADGAVRWEWTGPGTAGWIWAQRALTVDAAGNVIVAGDTEGVSGTMDLYVAKLGAATGAVAWEKTYHAPDGRNDTARAVAVDGAGNVLVTGSSEWQHAPPDAALLPDFYTAKYAAADGAVLWEHRYDGPAHGSDEATAITVDSAGNVTVAGTSGAFPQDGVLDFYTAHYAAADGALLWERRYRNPGTGSDSITAVLAGSDGAVVLAGSSTSGQEPDIYTASYAAADGAVRWEQRYGGRAPAPGNGSAVAMDAAGNIAVAGTAGGDDTDADFLTAKYSPSGTLLWERRYDGPASGRDAVAAMALDAAGNVIVTGQSQTGNNNFDFYTVKYAAADGAVLWERRYDGPLHWTDYPTALAVDAGGNVIVTGPSVGNALNFADYDIYTAKYAAGDGSLLWEQRGVRGYPYAVGLDSAGNVAVTGTIWRGPLLGAGFYTAKYAAATGALLWETNGTGRIQSEPYALAVDSAGDVIVTGQSANAFYTEKYASGTGAVQWSKVQHQGLARSVAVDSMNNIVIAGSSSSTGADTFKLAAADGALLWSRRSSLPYSGKLLALEPSGDAVISSGDGVENFTAKLRAADGTVLWEKVEHPFGPEALIPGAMALGTNNAIVLTGFSPGPDATGIFTTALYRYVPAPASCADWIASYGLSGPAAQPDSDPDGDGMSSSLEYLYGTNPAAPGPLLQPRVTTGTGVISYSFQRSPESLTPDVSCTVEAGPDLVSWPQVFTVAASTGLSSPGVTITGKETGGETVTVVLPAGDAARLFARLKVTVTP